MRSRLNEFLSCRMFRRSTPTLFSLAQLKRSFDKLASPKSYGIRQCFTIVVGFDSNPTTASPGRRHPRCHLIEANASGTNPYATRWQ